MTTKVIINSDNDDPSHQHTAILFIGIIFAVCAPVTPLIKSHTRTVSAREVTGATGRQGQPQRRRTTRAESRTEGPGVCPYWQWCSSASFLVGSVGHVVLEVVILYYIQPWYM